MYVRMYLCIHVRVYVCSKCAYVRMCMCVRECACVYVNVNVHVDACVCIQCVCACQTAAIMEEHDIRHDPFSDEVNSFSVGH